MSSNYANLAEWIGKQHLSRTGDYRWNLQEFANKTPTEIDALVADKISRSGKPGELAAKLKTNTPKLASEVLAELKSKPEYRGLQHASSLLGKLEDIRQASTLEEKQAFKNELYQLQRKVPPELVLVMDVPEVNEKISAEGEAVEEAASAVERLEQAAKTFKEVDAATPEGEKAWDALKEARTLFEDRARETGLGRKYVSDTIWEIEHKT